jgi:hypothetical protein
MPTLASFIAVLLSAAVLVLPAAAHAQSNSASDAINVKSVGRIAPIFSQIVYFHAPDVFRPIFEKMHGSEYIQESVLPDQTVSQWTEMITITGVRDFTVTHSQVTPRMFAMNISAGFQRACPASFAGKGIQEGQINGINDFMMVVSCGTSPTTDGKTSETAIIAVFKGDKDFYTLQWAERSAPSSTPTNIDVPMWVARMKRLMPLKLCQIVPGETAPYPSCVGS